MPHGFRPYLLKGARSGRPPSADTFGWGDERARDWIRERVELALLADWDSDDLQMA